MLYGFKLVSMNYYLIFAALLTSCAKEIKYSKEELFAKAKAADPSTTLILPNSMTEGISCSNYPEGCLAGHIVQIQNLDMIAVEFATEEQAKFAAKKMRGYYARNWLLDDVTGEPTLERFVSESLEAKVP